MKRALAFSFVFVFLMSSFSLAMEISGVNFDESLQVGSEKLVLNGVGLRKKLMVKVYAAGLYLKEKNKDPLAIMEKDEHMAMVLKFIHSEVPPDKLIEAWKEGFENSTKGDTSKIQNEISQFNQLFKEPAKKGDVYQFIYVPSSGVQVNINGATKVTIPGLSFKKALFGIWLCDQPADKGLKEGILGN